MKRKILTFGLVLSLTGVALSGCGNTAVKTESDKVVIESTAGETVQESEAEENKEIADAGEAGSTEETDAGEEEAETEVPTETEEPEPEPADWLEEHGIAITPQGDCQVAFSGCTQDGDERIPAGDFLADVNVSISETTEGAEEGFKKVSALFSMDVSSHTGTGFWEWNGAFDRYTGTFFDFVDTTDTSVNVGDHVTHEGFVTIQNGDEYYDVAVSYEVENQNPIIYLTITVTCPIDYDGVVFQIGYDSSELEEQYEQIDFSTRLYTIDELPYYGDGYLYFTMTND